MNYLLGAEISISTHKYVDNINEEFEGAIDKLPQELYEVSTISYHLENKYNEEKKGNHVLRDKELIM